MKKTICLFPAKIFFVCVHTYTHIRYIHIYFSIIFCDFLGGTGKTFNHQKYNYKEAFLKKKILYKLSELQSNNSSSHLAVVILNLCFHMSWVSNVTIHHPITYGCWLPTKVFVLWEQYRIIQYLWPVLFFLGLSRMFSVSSQNKRKFNISGNKL